VEFCLTTRTKVRTTEKASDVCEGEGATVCATVRCVTWLQSGNNRRVDSREFTVESGGSRQRLGRQKDPCAASEIQRIHRRSKPNCAAEPNDDGLVALPPWHQLGNSMSRGTCYPNHAKLSMSDQDNSVPLLRSCVSAPPYTTNGSSG